MKICPKCGRLVFFNSYFGAYICENCDWEDATQGKRRDSCVRYTVIKNVKYVKYVKKPVQ